MQELDLPELLVSVELRCWTGLRVLRRLVLMVVIAGTSADDYRGEEQDCNFLAMAFIRWEL